MLPMRTKVGAATGAAAADEGSLGWRRRRQRRLPRRAKVHWRPRSQRSEYSPNSLRWAAAAADEGARRAARARTGGRPRARRSSRRRPRAHGPRPTARRGTRASRAATRRRQPRRRAAARRAARGAHRAARAARRRRRAPTPTTGPVGERSRLRETGEIFVRRAIARSRASPAWNGCYAHCSEAISLYCGCALD